MPTLCMRQKIMNKNYPKSQNPYGGKKANGA